MKGYSDQKSKYPYEPQYIITHVDVTVHLLHDNICCWYACMKWHNEYKMYFDTIYITVIRNNMQNNCQA